MDSPDPRSDTEVLEEVIRRGTVEVASRQRRHRALASVAAAVVVIIVGAVVAAQTPSDPPTDRVVSGPIGGTTTSTTRGELTAEEGTTPMAESTLQARSGPITAWTGTEVLIWRGNGAFSDAGGGERDRSDGALYDPVKDTWRTMATSPLPPEPSPVVDSYVAAWSGTQLLVWGGPDLGAAAYDPSADEWTPFDPGPLDARTQASAVWTGTELFVFGGTPGTGMSESFENDPVDDGALYDPATDEWRAVPGSGAIRQGAQLLWDGDEVLVLGGYNGLYATPPAQAFDPADLAWRNLPKGPRQLSDTSAIWTGTEAVTFSREAIAAYDPAKDAWRDLGEGPDMGSSQTLAWTGQEVIVLEGGIISSDIALDVAALDPTTDTWRAIQPFGLNARNDPAAVWTGAQLIVWGGASSTGFTSEPYADGVRYDPGPGR